MSTPKKVPRLLLLCSVLAVLFAFLPSTLHAEKVVITYILRSGTTVRLVDRNTKELEIFHTDAEAIEGLANLPYLEKVVFQINAYLRDFSFLNDCPNLKVLHLMDCHPLSLDFLYRQHQLSELVMQGCNLGSNVIDISQMPSLNYIEISNSQLFRIPISDSNADSTRRLDCINLAYNQISNLSPVERRILDLAKFVIIEGNPLQIGDRRYLKGDLFKILPEPYRKYIR